MKVGDLVQPHSGIRHPWTEQHPGPWIGVIIELHKKNSARGGSTQAAVVCWNHPQFNEELQWTYQLEEINESR